MRKKRYICIYITYKTKNETSIIYSNRSAFSTAVVI